MTQIDKDRFFSMAECYDRMVEYLVPQYGWLQDRIVEMLFADGEERKTIVDLGAGSGRMLERSLTRYPDSRAIWVDYSPDFQGVARRRLARFVDRVQFVHSALEADWEAQLPDYVDAICSMSAIHHLEAQEKRRLYCRCCEAIVIGGWFVNIDEMRAQDDDAYLNTLHWWVRHVEKTKNDVPAELSEWCRAWCERFEGWKGRNIENRDQPKLKDDDIHDGYVEQLQWLREAGFVEVDLIAKFQLLSAIAGRRAERSVGGECAIAGGERLF